MSFLKTQLLPFHLEERVLCVLITQLGKEQSGPRGGSGTFERSELVSPRLGGVSAGAARSRRPVGRSSEPG